MSLHRARPTGHIFLSKRIQQAIDVGLFMRSGECQPEPRRAGWDRRGPDRHGPEACATQPRAHSKRCFRRAENDRYDLRR